jgi:hypothetical protein
MDEAEKFAEVAETKERGMGILLLKVLIAREKWSRRRTRET